MTTPASQYEYRGPKAAYWDLLRGDTSRWEDRPFYWAAIKASGEPALDVGCGTGRLLLDFLAQGIDIDGVDNSPEMLALCRHKAQTLGLSPALYEQYLENLSLPRHYRTILVPSSTLQLIVEPAMAQQALQRIYAHLLPGGALVAPFMPLRKAGEPLEMEWEKTAVRTEDGATFRLDRDNADAHLKRQVMGREVVVAITRGKLDFGPWEQIFYGEFDGNRPKRVLVKVIGE